MPSSTLKRRWTEQGMRGKAPKERKRVKRQRAYYSSSEDEGGALDAPRNSDPTNLDDSDAEQDEAQPKSILKPAAKYLAKIAARNPTEDAPTPKSKAKTATKQAPKKDLPGKSNAATADGTEDEEDSQLDEDSGEDEDDDPDADSDASDVSEGSEISETSTNNPRKVRKRNDPEAFATSISKILGAKLTTQKRSEPILSRSKAAQDTNKELADHKLTLKAHRKLLAEKKAAQEKGRVKDVLGLEKADVSTADIVAEEKKLRRTAQKGVIKLFNAVRAAQVKAEQAEKESREKGVIGLAKREEKVKEMSKQGFLDMIAGGGKKKEGSVDI